MSFLSTNGADPNCVFNLARMHSRGDRKAEEGECNHERCLDGKHGHCTVLVAVAAASAPEHCDKSKTHYAPVYASKQNATRAEEMAVQREEEEEKGGITPLEWKWERGLAPVAPPRRSGNNSPDWFSGKHPFDEVHNAA